MSTENLENNTGDTPADAPQEKTYSEVEQRALEMGWRPREEFAGEDEDFIDAKEFVARKPLYDKIAQQSKQLKSVTQAVEALKQHYGKVQETEYQRALKALKQERKQALVDGDADKFEVLEDEIKSVERQVDVLKKEQEIPIVKEEPTIHPEFAEWQNKNRWYTDVGYMRKFADELGAQLANTMPPAKVLAEVEKAVRKEFPHKFSNPNKANAPDVGSSGGSGRVRGADIQMTDQEKRIMDTLVRGGHITKEKYISDLKKAKGME